MKAFSTLVVLKAPPERLFATLRDRLPELAEAMDGIEAIDELERRQEDGAQLVVSRWHARQTVPSVLQERLGQRRIDWIDRARWQDERLLCTWDIEPSLGGGAIKCSGTTEFVPAMGGRGTRARFAGNLDIAPDYLGSVVGGFHGPVKALVEMIATSLIPANFRSIAEEAAKRTSSD
ncbi:MAG: SRPBCC family protein [Candidatus Wenzhouxiangella sp. M2_3B_020]